MGALRKYTHWTKEQVVASAAKFVRKNVWRRHSNGAYAASLHNGWHALATQHMISDCKVRWTKEKIVLLAKGCRTRTELCRVSSAITRAANRFDCWEEACAHMPKFAGHGRTLTADHRRKIGLARKGCRHSEKTKRRLSRLAKLRIGRVFSAAHRDHISRSLKGRQLSAAHKLALRLAWKLSDRSVRCAPMRMTVQQPYSVLKRRFLAQICRRSNNKINLLT